MKTNPIAILWLLLLVITSACNPASKTNPEASKPISGLDTIKGPADFYPPDRAQVLVVGTFHFEYPGLDTHKTADDKKVDVLKEPKKSELEELVAYIKKFKPNKIVIEARPTWNTMEKFEQYKNGGFAQKRDERFTIGMRIAKDLRLDTLYGLDAHSLISDLNEKDSVLANNLTDKIDWDIEDPYWDMATKWLDHEDELKLELSLLDYFKHLNSEEAHLANYGLYMTGNMGKAEGQAADHLSMWWYNRNLRIFSKIVNMTEGPDDRILVIFGNGHASIFRNLFEASPQYDYVEFDSL